MIEKICVYTCIFLSWIVLCFSFFIIVIICQHICLIFRLKGRGFLLIISNSINFSVVYIVNILTVWAISLCLKIRTYDFQPPILIFSYLFPHNTGQTGQPTSIILKRKRTKNTIMCNTSRRHKNNKTQNIQENWTGSEFFFNWKRYIFGNVLKQICSRSPVNL